MTAHNKEVKWSERSQSYRRGYVEGRDTGERDCYLLYAGCENTSEYELGFAEGSKERQDENA